MSRPRRKLTRDEVRQHAVDPDDGSKTYDYELLVIGGGSGGLAAAKQAAKHLPQDGKEQVALCDFVNPSPFGTTWGLGGTCVNVGCIPKKLMHTSALQGEALQHVAGSYGWNIGEAAPTCNWETLRANVDMHIRSLNFGYNVSLKQNRVKYFNAYATMVDAHTVAMKNKKGEVTNVTARRILLAMGGRPSYPDFPGAREFCITSDDIFKLKQEPGNTLVVGASYVALECAGFLTGIGRKATVVMRSIPLRGFDQDMANRVVSYMENHGTRFIRGYVPTSVERVDETTLRVTLENAETGEKIVESYNTVLLAIGRKPETDRINLSAVNVALAKSGKVLTDEFDRTSAPNIYAIGDIVEGGLELTPVAIQAGRLLADRLYAQGFSLMDYVNIPTTVFTPLEYGCVGYSEEDAKAKIGEHVIVYHSMFKPLEWTIPHLEDNVCYCKLIVDPQDNNRVVGFHILSPNAGEITQGVGVAMKAGATKEMFDETIGIHPTIAEEFTTMQVTKESGESAEKTGC